MNGPFMDRRSPPWQSGRTAQPWVSHVDCARQRFVSHPIGRATAWMDVDDLYRTTPDQVLDLVLDTVDTAGRGETGGAVR